MSWRNDSTSVSDSESPHCAATSRSWSGVGHWMGMTAPPKACADYLKGKTFPAQGAVGIKDSECSDHPERHAVGFRQEDRERRLVASHLHRAAPAVIDERAGSRRDGSMPDRTGPGRQGGEAANPFVDGLTD